jgi:hypothetical protein
MRLLRSILELPVAFLRRLLCSLLAGSQAVV